MPSLTIGLTGPIASGKSTFGKILSKTLNARLVDLDSLAKESYLEVKNLLSRELGREIYTADGTIKKQILFNKIFYNPYYLEKLEQILYPVLKEKVKGIIKESKKNREILLVEGVKLKEAGLLKDLDLVVLVIAFSDIRFERLKQRGLSTPKILALLNSQKRIYDYFKEANYVVWNNGDLKNLETEARKFLDFLKKNELV